jgi:hypothetical protein
VGRADSEIGKLTLSLRLGESAVVHTPEGDVEVKCVRVNGSKSTALSIQIIAPRAFPIDRKRAETGE